MKKTLLALSCCAFMSIHAQNPNVVSLVQPWKSDGYISWNKKSGTNYKVKIYQLVNNNYSLISTNTIDGGINYFKFNSSELVSTDLFYAIAEYNSAGVLTGESAPAAIGNNPPNIPICFVDCDGKREAYQINLMQRPNGSTYLSATETTATYYQAIHDANYDQFALDHPYRRMTANGIGNQVTYTRDHIRITDQITGHPYLDANNNVVPPNQGWLIEKKMDKFMHFSNSTTGNHQPSTDLCDANIGFMSTVFNTNLEPSTLMSQVGSSVTGDQTYFLQPTNTGGTTTYLIPNSPLECSKMPNAGGGPSGPPTGLGDFYDQIAYCFDMGTSDAGGDPLDCLLPDGPIGGGLDGTIDGITFESMSNEFSYSIFVDNNAGTTSTVGNRFRAGLYRINLFLADGRIVSGYRALGVAGSQTVNANVSIVIAPNPIVNNKLVFRVNTDQSVRVNIMVQKLDGTTLFTGVANLNPAGRVYSKELNITGDVPYNQLRISVILPDGTVIQQTALKL